MDGIVIPLLLLKVFFASKLFLWGFKFSSLLFLSHYLCFRFMALFSDWFCDLFPQLGSWQSNNYYCYGFATEKTSSSIRIPQVRKFNIRTFLFVFLVKALSCSQWGNILVSIVNLKETPNSDIQFREILYFL